MRDPELDATAIARRVRDPASRSLRFRWCDNANLVRAKAVHLPSLLAQLGAAATDDEVVRALERCVTICQSQMAIPVVADLVVPDAGLPPVHDVRLEPDWSTLSELPYAPGDLSVDVDIVDGDTPWGHCPRRFLREQSARMADAGLEPLVGVELELYLLRERTEGRSPEPSDSAPFALDGGFDIHHEVVGAILDSLTDQGIAVSQHHPESGPGQYEISLRPRAPLAAADAIVSARETCRAIARRAGLRATFLPVVLDGAASSASHLHLSVTGDPAEGLGESGRAFVAGLLAELTTLLAATCPSPNSYRRFRPHAWAGAYAAWGIENKEVPLRVVRTPEGGWRTCEVKAVDGTANPYIALGSLLAAGLAGIERGLSLPEPLAVDPADLSETERERAGIVALPTDPAHPLAAFEQSALFATAMGDLHRSYCAVKRYEHQELSGLDLDDEVETLSSRY